MESPPQPRGSVTDRLFFPAAPLLSRKRYFSDDTLMIILFCCNVMRFVLFRTVLPF